MITTEQRKQKLRARRHIRIRSRVMGTAVRPRISVFRSAKHITAQLIDDMTGKTLAHVSDTEVKVKGKKTDKALAVGKAIAEKAAALKISAAVFDRSGYRYHGRVKAVADGAREGGLQF